MNNDDVPESMRAARWCAGFGVRCPLSHPALGTVAARSESRSGARDDVSEVQMLPVRVDVCERSQGLTEEEIGGDWTCV